MNHSIFKQVIFDQHEVIKNARITARDYIFEKKEGIPRFYFFDNGILSLFLVDKNSALLENAVAANLRRRFDRSGRTGTDIDFYLPAENTAIQVAYSLGDARNGKYAVYCRLPKRAPVIRV